LLGATEVLPASNVCIHRITTSPTNPHHPAATITKFIYKRVIKSRKGRVEGKWFRKINKAFKSFQAQELADAGRQLQKKQ
jgi:hypothetical protein